MLVECYCSSFIQLCCPEAGSYLVKENPRLQTDYSCRLRIIFPILKTESIWNFALSGSHFVVQSIHSYILRYIIEFPYCVNTSLNFQDIRHMSLNQPVLPILGHYIMQYYGFCSTWQTWIFYSFFRLESPQQCHIDNTRCGKVLYSIEITVINW